MNLPLESFQKLPHAGDYVLLFAHATLPSPGHSLGLEALHVRQRVTIMVKKRIRNVFDTVEYVPCSTPLIPLNRRLELAFQEHFRFLAGEQAHLGEGMSTPFTLTDDRLN